MIDIKPFLEITVLHKKDPEISEMQILKDIKIDFLDYYKINEHQIKITKKPSLFIQFKNKKQFHGLYDMDFEIYSFLHQEILKNDLIFGKEIYKVSPDKKPGNDDQNENYLILQYRSNYLKPMRRNYNLIFRVNEIVGSKIYNEEYQEGFIRFIKTKADYKGMIMPGDKLQAWIDWLKLFKVDLNHPTMQEFIKILKNYLEKDKN